MMITVTNQRVGDHRDSILSPFLLHFFGLSVLPHLSGAAMKNRTRGRIVATQHKHQSRFSPTTFKQEKIIWVHLHHISPTDYFLLQRLFLQTEQTLLRASHTHTHSVSATVITAQHRHLFQFFFLHKEFKTTKTWQKISDVTPVEEFTSTGCSSFYMILIHRCFHQIIHISPFKKMWL